MSIITTERLTKILSKTQTVISGPTRRYSWVRRGECPVVRKCIDRVIATPRRHASGCRKRQVAAATLL